VYAAVIAMVNLIFGLRPNLSQFGAGSLFHAVHRSANFLVTYETVWRVS